MDERLRYEQLIGDKLQNLPVPDMQDAIWTRIKVQLDLDLPTDDGEGGSTPPSPAGPKIIGWSLAVVMIAFVTIFFIYKNKPVTKTNTSLPETSGQPALSPNTQNNSPPVPNGNSVNRPGAPAVTKSSNTTNDVNPDSVTKQNPVTFLPLTADSTRNNLQQPPSVTLSLPQVRDTSPVIKKKGRGMSGLNDSSYRIIPKTKD